MQRCHICNLGCDTQAPFPTNGVSFLKFPSLLGSLSSGYSGVENKLKEKSKEQCKLKCIKTRCYSVDYIFLNFCSVLFVSAYILKLGDLTKLLLL